MITSDAVTQIRTRFVDLLTLAGPPVLSILIFFVSQRRAVESFGVSDFWLAIFILSGIVSLGTTCLFLPAWHRSLASDTRVRTYARSDLRRMPIYMLDWLLVMVCVLIPTFLVIVICSGIMGFALLTRAVPPVGTADMDSYFLAYLLLAVGKYSVFAASVVYFSIRFGLRLPARALGEAPISPIASWKRTKGIGAFQAALLCGFFAALATALLSPGLEFLNIAPGLLSILSELKPFLASLTFAFFIIIYPAVVSSAYRLAAPEKDAIQPEIFD